MDSVVTKRRKYATKHAFGRKNKQKARQPQDACAKRDFSAAKQSSSFETQPCVVTAENSFAATAAVAGGRTVAPIVARSAEPCTEPCVGGMAAGDSVVPTAAPAVPEDGGVTGRRTVAEIVASSASGSEIKLAVMRSPNQQGIDATVKCGKSY